MGVAMVRGWPNCSKWQPREGPCHGEGSGQRSHDDQIQNSNEVHMSFPLLLFSDLSVVMVLGMIKKVNHPSTTPPRRLFNLKHLNQQVE